MDVPRHESVECVPAKRLMGHHGGGIGLDAGQEGRDGFLGGGERDAYRDAAENGAHDGGGEGEEGAGGTGAVKERAGAGGGG